MKSKINFGAKNLPSAKKIKTTPVQYTSPTPDLQQDSIDELSELEKQMKEQFKAKAKHEAALKDANTSTEFYSVIVFKTEAQRDDFLDKIGIRERDNRFISGERFSQAVGINVEKVNLKNPGKFQCNKDIANLALDI